MLQLTFGIPLSAFDFDLFPAMLRERATSLRFLRFGTEGFLIICRVPIEEQKALLRSLREHYRKASLQGAPLHDLKVVAEGRSMIRIKGDWFGPDQPRSGKLWRTFTRLRELERSHRLSIRSPVFVRDSIRVTVIAEAEDLDRLRHTLSDMNISYEVHGLRPLEVGSESPLGTLTAPQRRALLLAYALGYYQIPRKAGVGQVARKLRVNRGTAGRHLRRAERHLVEWAVTSPDPSSFH